MANVKGKIMDNALSRYIRARGEHADPAMYFENTVLQQGETIDIVEAQIRLEEPTNYVFVDEQPGLNWGHASQYLLYNAETGELSKEVNAKFPPFLQVRDSDTLECFKKPLIAERFKRARAMRVALEPATLTAYRTLGTPPFMAGIKGRQYAILFSGGSNCRHVNDFEFLYRTLLDLYGFNPEDIYVCNFDGNINWIPARWGEPAQDLANPMNYPVDNTPFRLQVNAQGTRAGFQTMIDQLAARIKPEDSVFLCTNNHGWYSQRPGGPPNEGLLSAYNEGPYWANDFVSDLSALPRFKTLLVVMEQCSSGSFIQPILNNSHADSTVIQTAVPAHESSAGGWFFDPWIELWISAMAGVRGDGSALAVSPDDNLDSRISAWEAYDFAIYQDNPCMQDTSTDLSRDMFLGGLGSLRA